MTAEEQDRLGIPTGKGGVAPIVGVGGKSGSVTKDADFLSKVLDSLIAPNLKEYEETVKSKEETLRELKRQVEESDRRKVQNNVDKLVLSYTISMMLLDSARKYDKKKAAYYALALVDAWGDYKSNISPARKKMTRKEAAAELYFLLLDLQQMTDNKATKKLLGKLANVVVDIYMNDKEKKWILADVKGILPAPRRISLKSDELDAARARLSLMIVTSGQYVTALLQGSVSEKDKIVSATRELFNRLDNIVFAAENSDAVLSQLKDGLSKVYNKYFKKPKKPRRTTTSSTSTSSTTSSSKTTTSLPKGVKVKGSGGPGTVITATIKTKSGGGKP